MSWVGIGLSIGSVIFMPMLGIAKERLADQLGSAATKGEGCCVSSPLDGAGFANGCEGRRLLRRERLAMRRGL